MITESYHAGEGRIFDAERTIRMYRSELAQKQREGNDRNRKRDKYGRSKTESKMNIALKEASESRYWIQHLTTAGCIDNGLSNLLLELLNNIINILSSIVNK